MHTIAPMTPSELEYRLRKRGFRLHSGQPLPCPACSQIAVIQYGISSKLGGRDIELCHQCGAARSWRTDGGHESRTLDDSFDIQAFLAP